MTESVLRLLLLVHIEAGRDVKLEEPAGRAMQVYRFCVRVWTVALAAGAFQTRSFRQNELERRVCRVYIYVLE